MHGLQNRGVCKIMVCSIVVRQSKAPRFTPASLAPGLLGTSGTGAPIFSRGCRLDLRILVIVQWRHNGVLV
jgi:hypothetical protein